MSPSSPPCSARVGAGAFVVGAVISLAALTVLGLVLLGAAGASFLLVPLLALFNSSRADREG